MGKTGEGILKNNDLIVYNIGSLYILLNQYFSSAYRPFQLTPAKFNILFLVDDLGGDTGIAQSELSDKLFVSAANITKIIDSMEKMSLVERLPSPHDRRVNLIRITEEGRKLLDAAWPTHIDVLNSICNDFTEDEKNTLKNLLDRFQKDVQEKVK